METNKSIEEIIKKNIVLPKEYPATFYDGVVHGVIVNRRQLSVELQTHTDKAVESALRGFVEWVFLDLNRFIKVYGSQSSKGNKEVVLKQMVETYLNSLKEGEGE